MKKAAEYAAEFKTSPTEQTLFDIAQAFVDEVKELVEMRNAKSNEACVSILDEQDRKWKAFSRRIDGIEPDGFVGLIKLASPVLYAYWRGKCS